MPNSYGDAIGWYEAGPLALEQTGPVALEQTGPVALEQTRSLALSDPSTKGANHTSLGYSPRKWGIETIQGLQARHHPVVRECVGYVGPTALRLHHYGRYPGRWPGLT